MTETTAELEIIPQIPMVHVYRAAMQSVVFTRKNGKPLIFQNHEYETIEQEDCDELDREIKEGKNPYLTYLGMREKDTRTPTEVFNSVVEAEVRKRIAMMDSSNDMGTYQAPAIKPASSADIADAAAGGGNLDSASLLQRIASAKKVS